MALSSTNLRSPDISAYLIIAIVLLLALAPLWHFAPSKRQRHQARLRERAAVAGLFVEFRDLPVSQQRLARMGASERQVLYYGSRLPPSRGDVRKSCSWMRIDGAWVSTPARIEAPESASDLPRSVLAFGVSEQSCGVYWQEQGDEKSVDELVAFLSDWRTRLLSS